MTKIYKDHRDIGRQVGQGTVMTGDQERQVIVMQIGSGIYAEHRIKPLNSLIPVPLDELEYEALSQLLKTIETFRALGLQDQQIEQSFKKTRELKAEIHSVVKEQDKD